MRPSATASTRRRAGWARVGVAFLASALIVTVGPPVPLLILLPALTLAVVGSWQHVAAAAAGSALLTFALVDAGASPTPAGPVAVTVLVGGLAVTLVTWLHQRYLRTSCLSTQDGGLLLDVGAARQVAFVTIGNSAAVLAGCERLQLIGGARQDGVPDAPRCSQCGCRPPTGWWCWPEPGRCQPRGSRRRLPSRICQRQRRLSACGR